MSNPTVEILNKMFAADPAAMQALVENRIPCNAELQAMRVPCSCTTPAECRCATLPSVVGLLGVLNAVLVANQLPRVAARFIGPAVTLKLRHFEFES